MKADSQPRLVPALERATYAAERPVRRFVGSNRLNPLPHAGTISVLLLIVVVVSGVYITLFFSYGFEASYESVEKMRDHPIQSLVRSIHRYSSAAFVLTTVVHAWRTFVAGRFRGPRRWRWTTGVASLTLVWLAGVTGYWLVWDERAEALNEATLAVGGGWSAVSDFFVRDVYGASAGSGWGVLFALWIVHLGLTAVIGHFTWRHVRRTRLPVLPPRHWMVAMFGALVIVSLLLPADLLEPADPARLVGDMPLDPFVLFLLPPLLSGWNWLAVLGLLGVVIAALVVPHVVRTATPVVEIDAERCTGCELCVVDCPYLALKMVDVSSTDAEAGVQPRRPLAVVDADACVGCGICLGSCSFSAMRLPGFGTALSSRQDLAADDIDPAGRDVVIACQRHLDATGRRSTAGSARAARTADDQVTGEQAAGVQVGEGAPHDGDGELVIGVSCSGMVHANSIGALTRAGATSVHVVGCAAGDCAYGLGNTLLAERLSGARAPHVAPKYAGLAAEDWVAPTDLAGALRDPGEHTTLDVADPPRGRRAVAAGVLVLVSVLAVGVATLAPFRGDVDAAGLRVLIDHRPGVQLEGQPAVQTYGGGEVVLAVTADGDPVAERSVDVGRGFAVELVDVELDVDTAALAVELREGDGVPIVLFDGPVDLGAGERIVVEAIDVPAAPGVEDGKQVFGARNAGACGVCHSTKPGADGVGPSLAGVGTRAASRVGGLSAEEYLRQSIIDPDAYVVDGYRAGQMLPIYEDRLSTEEIDALIEYLLSLTADPEAGS